MQQRLLKVFGKTAAARGNLTAIVDVPGNPEDSGVEVAVLLAESEVADVRMRFFYPGSLESPICGHAVLAAASTLDGDAMTVETGAGVYRVRKAGDRIFVRLSPHLHCTLDIHDRPEPAWFGLQRADILAEGVFSAGKPKYCVELASPAALAAASFDAARLKAWNAGKDFAGYVLYARGEDGLFVRASNPLFNIVENDACAVCCAALPPAGERAFTAWMDPPAYDSELFVEPDPEGVWVGGRVFAA